MKLQIHSYRVALVTTALFLVTNLAQAKPKSVCDEPKPEDKCTAVNTCGSDSAECTVNIKKAGESAKVKPLMPNAKDNQLFCVKAGTSVVWKTTSKNSGFSISFEGDSPFVPSDPIVGGGSKPIRVKAQTPGCYKYDAGAFTSGVIKGMSGGTKRELVILP